MSHADDLNPHLDPLRRRASLTTQVNPALRLDYRVTLSAPLVAGPGLANGARVTVDYVPDRRLLDPAGLTRYMTELGGLPWPGPEALGVAILDDINNEVVPRWLRVTVRAVMEGGGEAGGPPNTDTGASTGTARMIHRVILEDRQPHWNEGADAVGRDVLDPARRG